MKNNDKKQFPPLAKRLHSVWYRHFRVYSQNLLSNGFPPFVEPLIFLAGVGLGLGRYIDQPMEGMRYVEYLGTGLLVTTAMFTSAFECSFGTFIRLEFQKVYDGMLAAPLSVRDLIAGEILWAGSKGLFFSFAVLCVLSIFGIAPMPYSLGAPLVGFITGLMFGSMSLFVASFVKTINHFNFYFTGFISPMFFFSGVVFPIDNLPAAVRPFAQVIPLTHSVKLVRAVCTNDYHPGLWTSLAYAAIFITIFSILAVKRLKKRMIS